MKTYTRTGDKGTTSLVGGTRASKSCPRLEAYGTVDELNSWIGLVLSCSFDDELTRRFLTAVQNKLFDLGASLATEIDSTWIPKTVTEADIESVEKEIDRLDEGLPRHNRFVLPQGTQASSMANVARTVCRRAERLTVSLPENTCPGQWLAIGFLNRLSDYLFVLSRHLNVIAGVTETYWDKDAVL